MSTRPGAFRECPDWLPIFEVDSVNISYHNLSDLQFEELVIGFCVELLGEAAHLKRSRRNPREVLRGVRDERCYFLF